MLKDSHAIAAKTSLEVMISLYKVFLIFVKFFTVSSKRKFRTTSNFYIRIFNIFFFNA